MTVATDNLLCTFAKDVLEGLSRKPKKLSSKYFYDDTGSGIFQEIMEMPEYYLTDCELEILQQQSGALHYALQYQEGFNIIELGAGDGAKTKEFLSYLVRQKVDITYVPVDISVKALEILEQDLSKEMRSLDIHPLAGDYFEVLEGYDFGNKPALFLFLGSNIGNYEQPEAIGLLKMIRNYMRSGDQLLIGFDLKKNPFTILNAYNDPHGITYRFNMNLLARMNRELGANFAIEQFDFYPFYDPRSGEVRSHLFSKIDQEVWIDSLGQYFHFQKNELIYTELSKKYGLEEIEHLAKQSGFVHKEHFLDSRNYFSDSLWVKE